MRISDSADVERYLRGIRFPKHQEMFGIIALNEANEVIGRRMIALGATRSVCVDPRIIFIYLVQRRAASFITFHNHPSGNLTPSQDDYSTFKTLSDCGKLLNIPCLDNIIYSPRTGEIWSDVERLHAADSGTC